MTEVDLKLANKAANKGKAGKASASSEVLTVEAVVAAAPKSPRKRAPTVPRAAPAKAETPVTSAPVAGKSAVKQAPRALAVAAAFQESRSPKAKKVRLVRDSFTMPEPEYAAIAALKARCLTAGVAAKKSEILRAAISALTRLDDAELAAAIQGLAAIKTG